MKKKRNKLTVEQKQKDAIVRLCGLFLFVYSVFCFIPNGIGPILATPYTLLFGSLSLIALLFVFTISLSMLIFKKVYLKYLRSFQGWIIGCLFLMIQVVISIGVVSETMTISTCFDEYFNIYEVKSVYECTGLGGGLVGFVFLGLINRFTDMHFVITKIVSFVLLGGLSIAFLFPLVKDLISWVKKIIVKAKIRKEKNERIKLEKLNSNPKKLQRLKEKEAAKELKEKERQERLQRKYQERLLLKEKKKQERLEKKKDTQIRRDLQKKMDAINKEETQTIRLGKNGKIDDLLETTEINVSGNNYSYVSQSSIKNQKLKNLIDCYDDEIYDDYYKKCMVVENVPNNYEGYNDDLIVLDGDQEELLTETIAFDNEALNQIKEDNVQVENYQEENVVLELNEVSKTDYQDFEEINKKVLEKESLLKEESISIVNEDYQLPPLSLLHEDLDNSAHLQNVEYAKQRLDIINEKFEELDVNCTATNFVVGPAVTRYEIVLAPGVRVNTITSLQDDIKLALGVSSLRMESPIPGKIGTIGIEVPNLERSTVSLSEVIKQMPNRKNKLYVPIGKDVAGNPLSFSICDMPHCLIAGATNSGKSVCINTIILSLLLNYTPSELKLLMVNPKQLDMVFYKDIPHLLCPVIKGCDEARVALGKLCEEMDRRLIQLSEQSSLNLQEYNERAKELGKEPLPFIVCIIDEFADLMLNKNHQLFEDKVQRLSQLGRAAGIHMIIATQRPDVNVIQGTIKNNFPCRMAFRLSSNADSRTVIDNGGAEKLLNNGDMLLLTPDFSGLRRIQGVFASKEEIIAICNHCRSQEGPNYDNRYMDLRTEEKKQEEEKLKYAMEQTSFLKDDNDPMYEEIKEFVIREQKASTSLFERRFRIGYGKAARYIDRLEEDGIIGPENGTKGREVLKQK